MMEHKINHPRRRSTGKVIFFRRRRRRPLFSRHRNRYGGTIRLWCRSWLLHALALHILNGKIALRHLPQHRPPPRLDKIGSFQFFSTFDPRLSFLQKLNWCWLGGWIFLPCHFFCTGALTAEKLTIWPNCSFHTETSKAKWIQFGWQCWSDKLGSNEKRTMVLNPCSFGGWIICCIFLKNGYSCSILKVKV